MQKMPRAIPSGFRSGKRAVAASAPKKHHSSSGKHLHTKKMWQLMNLMRGAGQTEQSIINDMAVRSKNRTSSLKKYANLPEKELRRYDLKGWDDGSRRYAKVAKRVARKGLKSY